MIERTNEELVSENQVLRAAFEGMKAERDLYRNGYLAITEKDMPEITQADLESAIETGPWFEQWLDLIVQGDPDPCRVVPFDTPIGRNAFSEAK